jgi:hypothetical protein
MQPCLLAQEAIEHLMPHLPSPEEHAAQVAAEAAQARGESDQSEQEPQET